jgi:ribosomal protein L14
MKGVAAKMTNGLNIGSMMVASDNSGARIVRITGVEKAKKEDNNMQKLEIM